ncbi:MAG: radical SAM protein [Candidatus Riflebacteria bacterium]|nr:radical SAM protein [Candidatus Riflebacteria bacterium]
MKGKYGFGGRLTESFPSQVIIDVTEVCNLACIHCPHADFVKSEHYSGRHLDPALNRKAVDEVRECGNGGKQLIRYSSEGETLLHPHAFEMLDYAVRHSGAFVTLTTNGTILPETEMKNLLSAGLHLIDVSIDAFSPETYREIRRGGSLQITQANVKNLLRWVRECGAKTKILVTFIEQPANCHEVGPFTNFWKEQGIEQIIIRRLHSAAGAVKWRADAQHSRQMGRERRPCIYPWERVLISPRGEIAYCPADWSHASTVADFREKTIAETWCGKFYQALREAHLKNSFSCFPFCSQCPDWEEVRWPDEGRGYGDLIGDAKGA